MLADLDLLLTAVFATADDLLPERARNARRSVTDAEVVTLAVAQAVIDVPSNREFLAVAAGRLGHLFPKLPQQPGYWKRRLRLAETIEWLCAMFAQDSPGYFDDVVLVDSTPVECGRSVDTARRSALAPACAHHYSRSHSRWFWGMRQHLLAAADGTPRAAILASADQKERDVALRLFAIGLRGGELVVCDKGYAGRDFQQTAADRYGARILRPARRNEPAPRPRALMDPPADRIDLLHPQRPPRSRTPPRPQPARATGTNRDQTARPQRRRLAKPLPRPTQPRLCSARRLTQRGINHLVGWGRSSASRNPITRCSYSAGRARRPPVWPASGISHRRAPGPAAAA
jgi:hypothetical protein